MFSDKQLIVLALLKLTCRCKNKNKKKPRKKHNIDANEKVILPGRKKIRVFVINFCNERDRMTETKENGRQ